MTKDPSVIQNHGLFSSMMPTFFQDAHNILQCLWRAKDTKPFSSVSLMCIRPKKVQGAVLRGTMDFVNWLIVICNNSSIKQLKLGVSLSVTLTRMLLATPVGHLEFGDFL